MEEREETNNTRLIINVIENTNFKSFFGKKTIGPFNCSFTAIIGPNGNGKSNIIDSILFVFGYRSNKIRSKKVSQLIYHSEEYINDPIDFCSVKIFFDEIDSSKNVVNSFTVCRVARRDNSSQYMVDDKNITFSDLKKFLLKYNIDINFSRFLILQGQVEQISLMKPKATVVSNVDSEKKKVTVNDDGFLEYLEDVIGTSVYIEPINEIKVSLDEHHDLYNEQMHKTKLAETDCLNIEPAKKLAEDFLRDDLTLAKHRALQLFRQKEEVCSKNQETIQMIQNFDEQLNAKNELLQEAVLQQTSIKNQVSQLEKSGSPLKKSLNLVKDLILKIEKQQTEFVDNVEKFTEQIDEIGEKIHENSSFKDGNEQRIMNSTNQLKTLESAKTELEAKKTSLETEVDAEYEKLLTTNNTYKKLVESKKNKEVELENAQNQYNRVVDDIESVKNEKELLNQPFTQINSQIEANKKVISEKSNLLESLQKTIAENNTQLEVVQRELDENVTKDASLNKKIVALENEIKIATVNYNKKVSSNNNSKSNNAINKIVSALLKAQISQNNVVSGVIDRVGELVSIDEKYDVAASTAFKSTLDNILVQNMDCAMKCVKFLRDNNLGTATFVCLDKMETFRDKMNVFNSPKNNVNRLFDLVKYKSEQEKKLYSPVIYFVMRDTLVCDDIKQANALAYSNQTRNRVVTVNGEIFEKSGTISGGGNVKISGKLKLVDAKKEKISEKTLNELEESFNTMSNNLNEMNKTMAEYENEKDDIIQAIENLKKKKKELEISIRKMKNSIESEQAKIAFAEKKNVELNLQLKEINVDDSSLAEFNKKIDRLIEKKVELTRTIDKIRESLITIDEKISSEMQKSGMYKCKIKLDSVVRMLDETKENIIKIKAELAENENVIKEKENSLKSLQKKKNTLENKRKCLFDNLLKFLSSLKENVTLDKCCIDFEPSQVFDQEFLAKANEQMENMLTFLNEKQRHLQCESDKLAASNNEFTEKTIAISEKITAIKNEINEISSKRAKTNKAYDEILKTLRNIEEQIESTVQKCYSADQLKEELKNVDPTSNNSIESSNPDLIEEVNARMKNYTNVNINAIDMYKEKSAVYCERVQQLEEIMRNKDAMNEQLEELNKKRTNEFVTGFNQINKKLKQVYNLITMGGDAELEFVDSMDPFIEGVVFSVRPPNKTWKTLSNLSGGERTLSSLALVFALQDYKPSPFYVMDEIDAALDFKNVSIIANYIKERTSNSQFLIISLRNNMFELANSLIGIYKTHQCTKTVMLNIC